MTKCFGAVLYILCYVWCERDIFIPLIKLDVLGDDVRWHQHTQLILHLLVRDGVSLLGVELVNDLFVELPELLFDIRLLCCLLLDRVLQRACRGGGFPSFSEICLVCLQKFVQDLSYFFIWKPKFVLDFKWFYTL